MRQRQSNLRVGPWRRCGVAVVALWLLVAMPLLALPPEILPVCTMACSLDGDSCCCRALGHRAPFSVTGEASYLASHIPAPAQGQCQTWWVTSQGPELPPPSRQGVVYRPRPVTPAAVDERPTAVLLRPLSAPALPRPPPRL